MTNDITQMQTDKWLPEDKEARDSVACPFICLADMLRYITDLMTANQDCCVFTPASHTGNAELFP